MPLVNTKLMMWNMSLHMDYAEDFLLDELMDQIRGFQWLKMFGGVVSIKKNLSRMTSNFLK